MTSYEQTQFTEFLEAVEADTRAELNATFDHMSTQWDVEIEFSEEDAERLMTDIEGFILAQIAAVGEVPDDPLREMIVLMNVRFTIAQLQAGFMANIADPGSVTSPGFM